MWRTIFCATIGLLLAAGSQIAAQGQRIPAKGPELKGKIMKIDPRGVLTIQTGEGQNAVLQNYLTNGNTKYYGYNNLGMIEGLRNSNFRPGANVYYRPAPAPGNTATQWLSELRVGPTVPQLPAYGQ